MKIEIVLESSRAAFGLPRMYADAFYRLGAWHNVSTRFQRRIWRDVVLPSDLRWTEKTVETDLVSALKIQLAKESKEL